MALDPNDPLIPLPWQMGNIRAYRAQKAVEAEKDRLKFEELQLDLAEKRRRQEMESPSGRATTAAEVSAKIEEINQKERGIPIGKDIGEQMLKAGGPSILEATKMQGQMDIDLRAQQAYKDALTAYLTEKSLTPTAKVDVGGITQTVPAMQAPQIQADTQTEIYNASVPRFKGIFLSQGYSEQEATKLASDAATKEIIKNSNSGKISMLLQDGSIVSLDLQKAMQMAKDPSTPPSIKSQIIKALGETETPKASTWVNTRLGR